MYLTIHCEMQGSCDQISKITSYVMFRLKMKFSESTKEHGRSIGTIEFELDHLGLEKAILVFRTKNS